MRGARGSATIRPLLRTAQDALDLLRRERVLTLTPAGGPRSLVGEIAGEVRGSWWGHPQGSLIYSIATALEESPEVLGAKLVRGKVTFVHSALWPKLLRVVLDPEWRRGAERALPTAARQLLAEVEREGTLRLQGRAPARLELEKRGLVLATSEHTASGRLVTRGTSPYGSFELAAGDGYVATSSLLRGTLAIYSSGLRLLRVVRLAPATPEVAISRP